MPDDEYMVGWPPVNINPKDTQDWIVNHLKQEQYIANEAAMQPLLIRLDKIVYLLEKLLKLERGKQ